MTIWLKQSTAATLVLGPFVDSVDGFTAKTALTIAQADVRLSKNGAAFAQKSDATSATHMENGYYSTPINATDTGTLGVLDVAVVKSGALPVWKDVMVLAANVYDSLVAASANLAVDATKISADATAATNLKTAFNDTAGAVPWLGLIDQGTAQAATGTTIQLRAAATFADDTILGATVFAFGSTQGYWQSRVITDYAGATDTATVDTWQVTPSGTITYKIIATAPASTTAPAPVNVVQAAGTLWGSGAITAASIATDAITAAKIADGAIDANTFAADSITANAIAANAIGSSEIAAGAITNTKFAAGAIDAAAIAADAIGASELATDAVTEIVNAIWNELTASHTTVGTFGQFLQSIRSGTAQAGAAGTITLDAGASASDDFYKNSLILITSGTGANQIRTIASYVGATKVATVTPNWVTNPSGTSVFAIIPNGAIAGASAPTAADNADAVWNAARSTHTGAGSFGEGVASVQGNVTGSAASVTGAVGSVTGNVNGNVAGSVASVTGNVAGNVVGSVGSVTGGVGGNVSGSVGSLATQAKTDVAAAIFAHAFPAGYNGLTFEQCVEVMVAALAGTTLNMGTATGHIRNLANTADVIVATIDIDGNRAAVVLTP